MHLHLMIYLKKVKKLKIKLNDLMDLYSIIKCMVHSSAEEFEENAPEKLDELYGIIQNVIKHNEEQTNSP